MTKIIFLEAFGNDDMVNYHKYFANQMKKETNDSKNHFKNSNLFALQ